MSIIYEERPSDSPFVETVTHGYMIAAGSTVRPAECHWHMVFVKHNGRTHPLVVGPLMTSGVVAWTGTAEVLWIKLKLGTFMPHLPTSSFLDIETPLPESSGKSFWLKGSTWQFPDFENADTFVNSLVHDDVLARDPVVDAALHHHLPDISPRTLRHRFLQATGLPQNHIRQHERALRAAALLRQGVTILDTVYEAGYFDQPHLTRSLKRFIGHTPAQLTASNTSL